VLIPFPQATDDHQTHNARSLVDAGGAILVPQAQLEPERFAQTLAGVLDDRSALKAMRQGMASAARPRAAAEIFERLVTLSGRT
jgi:UDP-N-acetylglucosamine--N-acetylmuramyl-(pentapeptide) pyrophosphoryl-undecaprenol N-acetylglucosamine transferase